MKIFVLALEPSGDALGAAVLKKIGDRRSFEIRGIGGEHLIALGLKSEYPMQQLGFHGLSFVPALPKIIGLLRRLREKIVAWKPDIVLSIDSPDFMLRLVKGLPHDLLKVHLVSPTVWAWRPKRARVFERFFSKMLCLFPFEPAYYRPGFAHFIGHPLLFPPVKRSFSDTPLKLGLYVGSRTSEITRLLDPFLEVAQRLVPSGTFLLPTTKDWKKTLEEEVAKRHIPRAHVVRNSPVVMRSLDVALVASGTVTMELGMAGVAQVVAYRLSTPVLLIYRGMKQLGIKTPKYMSIVNHMAEEEILPEIFPTHFDTKKVEESVRKLLCSSEARRHQIERAQTVLQPLLYPLNSRTAADAAADTLLSFL